jgi:hypothetical protein
VPATIGKLEEPDPVLSRHESAVARQIGKVRDAGTQPMPVAFADVAGRFVAFEFAEMAGKGKLLLVGERLFAKHQDGVALHGRIDRLRDGLSQWGAAFDAADLGGERAWN